MVEGLIVIVMGVIVVITIIQHYIKGE